jgi:hypothetical protein
MTHVTQVLLNPEKPVPLWSISRRSRLGSLCRRATDLCQSLQLWMSPQKTAAAQPGMTSIAFRGTALEAQRAVNF